MNENGVKGSSYNSENVRAFGNKATYRIAKLKRDHPDIADAPVWWAEWWAVVLLCLPMPTASLVMAEIVSALLLHGC